MAIPWPLLRPFFVAGLLLWLVAGCQSSDYKQGYEAGVKAVRTAKEQVDGNKKTPREVQQEVRRPLREDPTRSDDWKAGYREAVKWERWLESD